MAEAKTFRTLQDRLAKYGLEHLEGGLASLKVQPGQTLKLSPDDPQSSKFIKRLRPQSPNDLKRWIGVPNSAFAKGASPVFIPQPPIKTDNPVMHANLANFLFANSSAVTDKEIHALHSYVTRINIAIAIYVLFDIYISAGSTLVVDESIQILWARYIEVEQTGVLQMNSPFAKIDCAGFRSIIPFHVGPVQRAGTTATGILG